MKIAFDTCRKGIRWIALTILVLITMAIYSFVMLSLIDYSIHILHKYPAGNINDIPEEKRELILRKYGFTEQYNEFDEDLYHRENMIVDFIETNMKTFSLIQFSFLSLLLGCYLIGIHFLTTSVQSKHYLKSGLWWSVLILVLFTVIKFIYGFVGIPPLKVFIIILMLASVIHCTILERFLVKIAEAVDNKTLAWWTNAVFLGFIFIAITASVIKAIVAERQFNELDVCLLAIFIGIPYLFLIQRFNKALTAFVLARTVPNKTFDSNLL